MLKTENPYKLYTLETESELTNQESREKETESEKKREWERGRDRANKGVSCYSVGTCLLYTSRCV